MNRTMLAAVLDSPAPVEAAPLKLRSIAAPRPAAGEVLVRVHSCGVCRTDLHVVEGELPPRRSQVIPGHQIVGVVEAIGECDRDSAVKVGERVGVAWQHRTCGTCRFCRSERENLCVNAQFTGYTVNGGFAEFITAPADFVYRLPENFSDLQTAPLLCAGIIGYRSLQLTNLHGLNKSEKAKSRPRLGIYGFGAAGHVVIQLARGRGIDVFVCTRDRERHQALAMELGATWVGGATDRPPELLDASIIFAPAGELIPPALQALDKGGSLVLGGIHMSDVPSIPYRLIYGERIIRSVANNTRDDGREFLHEAANLPVHTSVQEFPLEKVNEALLALKTDAIRGAAVIRMAS